MLDIEPPNSKQELEICSERAGLFFRYCQFGRWKWYHLKVSQYHHHHGQHVPGPHHLQDVSDSQPPCTEPYWCPIQDDTWRDPIEPPETPKLTRRQTFRIVCNGTILSSADVLSSRPGCLFSQHTAPIHLPS